MLLSGEGSEMMTGTLPLAYAACRRRRPVALSRIVMRCRQREGEMAVDVESSRRLDSTDACGNRRGNRGG